MSTSRKQKVPVRPTARTPVPDAEPQKPKGFVTEFLQDMAGTRRLAKKNEIALLAASVGFFCLFALLPFLILSFLGSRTFLGPERTVEVLNELGGIVETLMPAVNSRIFHDLTSVLNHNIAGDIFNFATLVWSTYGLFTGLHSVFVRMSKSGGQRTLFWTNLVSVGCFLVGMGASNGFLILSTNPDLLRDVSSGSLEKVPLSEMRILASMISLMLVLSCITYVFKFMPTQKVRLTHAFRGSVLFLTLFMVGRATYHVYLVYYRYMNEQMFGTFFTILVVIAWIYYIARIFLFSAQYTLYLQEKTDRKKQA
jgi:membrane protein